MSEVSCEVRTHTTYAWLRARNRHTTRTLPRQLLAYTNTHLPLVRQAIGARRVESARFLDPPDGPRAEYYRLAIATGRHVALLAVPDSG